ncbi:MAG: hypothetical protein ACRCXZ_06675 [Patescibacteria group bacterium]
MLDLTVYSTDGTNSLVPLDYKSDCATHLVELFVENSDNPKRITHILDQQLAIVGLNPLVIHSSVNAKVSENLVTGKKRQGMTLGGILAGAMGGGGGMAGGFALSAAAMSSAHNPVTAALSLIAFPVLVFGGSIVGFFTGAITGDSILLGNMTPKKLAEIYADVILIEMETLQLNSSLKSEKLTETEAVKLELQ